MNTDNGVKGPAYLEGLTEHINNPEDLHDFEWRRKLKATNGNTKFKIKYYGKLHDKYTNLIVGTDFSQMLVYAIEPESGQEILLFDGCRYGYNAMLCDEYTQEQLENRPPENTYADKNGNELFEVIVSTYNTIDYEDEFGDEADENNCISSDNGTMVSLDELQHNGFDCIGISLIDDKGNETDVVSEELA